MMKDYSKYAGIIPAFYACYDSEGNISPKAVQELTQYYIQKGVKGLYVGGSSGECIYQGVAERKLLLENVMAVAKGRLTIIAHVACNNTKDSMELAAHAESVGVDAIAAIPPIYFHLPDAAIAKYWNDISSAAPNTDFIIYNIPQLAGVALNPGLLKTMLENPRCIGVKNSSMPIEDIERWISCGAIVFNGPDEQLLSGVVAGATGAIGGTYGAMPEVYLKIFELAKSGENLALARELQQRANQIIYKMCSGGCNMYAMIKEILRQSGGPDVGGVRAPLLNLAESDKAIAQECVKMIAEAKALI
jgi:N-acetylneuraminate lyase